MEDSMVLIGGEAVSFSHNMAVSGGGMNAWGTSVRVSATLLEFVGNFAEIVGGGLRIGTNFGSDSVMVISATFRRGYLRQKS